MRFAVFLATVMAAAAMSAPARAVPATDPGAVDSAAVEAPPSEAVIPTPDAKLNPEAGAAGVAPRAADSAKASAADADTDADAAAGARRWPQVPMSGGAWIAAGLDRDLLAGVASALDSRRPMSLRSISTPADSAYSAPQRSQVGVMSGGGQFRTGLVMFGLTAATLLIWLIMWYGLHRDATRGDRRRNQLMRERREWERSLRRAEARAAAGGQGASVRRRARANA